MKKILSLLLCAVLLFSLAACGAKPAEGKTVITTFYPVYIFTSNLLNGIDGIKAVNMTENQGGCLHDYRLMPGDMKLLADSEAIVINGAGMEGFLDKIIENEPNLPVIDSSENIEVICGEEHEGEEEEHAGHDHAHEGNSHIWLSVPNAKKQVMNIAAGLSGVFPEYAEEIKANEAEYLARLSALDTEIRAELEDCRNAKFISFHKAYDYLAAEYGITFSASVETDDGAEPGTRELAALSKMIPAEGVAALFTEPDYQGSSADILAAETGVPVYELNPVIRGNGALTSYEDIMRSNSEIIRKAAKADEG